MSIRSRTKSNKAKTKLKQRRDKVLKENAAVLLQGSVKGGQGAQELLPGLPDHITLQLISPKLEWRTFKMLQMVNWRWWTAIRDRSVYDARVFADSREAFLVLAQIKRTQSKPCSSEITLDLYSCKLGFTLRLPPIPPFPFSITRLDESSLHYICLDGRVYFWVIEDYIISKDFKLYVLDLGGGDGKWIPKKSMKHQIHNPSGIGDHCTRDDLGYGVLGGKILKFHGNTPRYSGVLEVADAVAHSDDRYEHFIPPQTEVYDPLDDAWAPITSMLAASASEADHLPSIREWAEEQQAQDSPKNFLIHGRYEPFFSEWRQRQSFDCTTTSGTADHVYYKTWTRTHRYSSYYYLDEMLFFLDKELLRFRQRDGYLYDRRFGVETVDAVIQVYDTRKDTWELWKSFSADFHPLNKYPYRILSIASADHALWAIMFVCDRESEDFDVKYILVRSSGQLDKDSSQSAAWIDTGYCACDSAGRYDLRPIYL